MKFEFSPSAKVFTSGIIKWSVAPYVFCDPKLWWYNLDEDIHYVRVRTGSPAGIMKDGSSKVVCDIHLHLGFFNEEQVTVAEKQVAVSNQQVKRLEKLVKAGQIPEGNLLDLHHRPGRRACPEHG